MALLTAASARAQDTTHAADTATLAPAHPTTHSVSLSLGVTVQSDSKAGDEAFSADILTGLEAKIFMDGEPFQIGASVYAKYGQVATAHEEPQKTQDDLIASITPSYTVLPALGIRLFLEVTGETQFRPGIIDTAKTDFLDPLFLYQSLFLGKRLSSLSADGNTTFDLTAGVGYALEQTVANSFVLQSHRNFVVTDKSPLSSVQDQVTFESGIAGIIDMNYQTALGDGFGFHSGWKTVAMKKEEFFTNFENARVTSLLLAGLQYKIVSLDYSGHLVYDPNISLRRQLSQTLVFGLTLNL
ncbi:MAG: hypothetical protein Q8922_05585 [Bacteroidota bacterium]|nr:hypothetical protein [Bacteroidota bacterium]MDP4241730.1 hypothetical protein [Bacteroidota bacterium]MDP4287388.1 hypothetical protein [Bacteroidota bacterium]